MKKLIRLEMVQGTGATVYYKPDMKVFVAKAPWLDNIISHDTIRGVRDSIRAAYQLKVESAKLEGMTLFWNSHPSEPDGTPAWNGDKKWWTGKLEKVTREGARGGTFNLMIRSPDHPHPFRISESRAYVAGKRKAASKINSLDSRIERLEKARSDVLAGHLSFTQKAAAQLIGGLPAGDKRRRRSRGGWR